MKNRQKPGLKAIRDARESRGHDQAMARPMGMFHVLRASERVSMTARIFAVSGVVGSLVLYSFVSGYQLDQAKEKLLSRQRAAQQTLGADWFPLRDKLERIVRDASGDAAPDTVDDAARTWDFRTLPGLYLRLRLEDARQSSSLREAAQTSVHDGFTGCLLRQSTKAAAESDAGAFNDQPWNLRQAYRATRVLDDVWSREAKNADSELRLRIFEQQFDGAVEREIPLAASIVKKATFFLLVLDEDVDDAKRFSDGGTIDSEALQQVAHPTRVVLYDLRKDALAFRLRREASASFRFAGEGSLRDPSVLAAMQRQVNNCALADEVWRTVHISPP